MKKPDRSTFLVTGAGGMIGGAVPWGAKLSRGDLDLSPGGEIERKLESLSPSGILHLAAMDLRQCEANPALALEVNVAATVRLAEFARKRGIPFVFLSSGALFNGPFGATHFEDSRPEPLNVYGQTKYLAEKFLARSCPAALIVRTGWVFGGHGAHHRKFVDVAIEKALAGETIQASGEQEGSPTFVKDLVLGLEQLIDEGRGGVWHLVNSGRATAAAMAKVIAESLSSRSTIQRLPNSAFQGSGPGTPARSPSEVLASRELKLRSWQDALEEMIALRESLPAEADR